MVFKPDYKVSVGDIVDDIIQSRNISRLQLADMCIVEPSIIDDLIDNHGRINDIMADKLESALGIRAYIFINLNNSYHDK